MKQYFVKAAFKTLIAISLLFITCHTFAQCNFDVNETDPFTKEVRRSKTMKIGPEVLNSEKNKSVGWSLTLGQEGHQYFIKFEFVLFGRFFNVLPAGEKILLKLSNDQTQELTTEKDEQPVAMAALAVYTHYSPKISLTSAQMKQLADADITFIKVTIGGKPQQAEISGKSGGKVSKLADCIVENAQ